MSRRQRITALLIILPSTFCLSLLPELPWCDGGGLDIGALFRPDLLTVTYFQNPDHVSLCIDLSLLQKEGSLVKTESSTDVWHQHKHLGGSLTVLQGKFLI